MENAAARETQYNVGNLLIKRAMATLSAARFIVEACRLKYKEERV